MKKKESRWTSNNARLRAKIDQLEMENEELREEIKLLEKKRLDWMQKDRVFVLVCLMLYHTIPTLNDPEKEAF